jgi:putative DNA primase/helicase
MTAAQIAAALGGRREGCNWRCCCPLHGGRSLTLRDGRSTLLVRCWASCSTRDVLAELRRLGLLAGRSDGALAPAAMTTRGDDRQDTARRIEIARRIWGEARQAHGSPVARYLAGRGITVPVPPTLRWAPSLRRPDGTAGPAMIARVVGLDGELIGVHRTWLYRDAAGVWRRRDRASLGPVGGGAVRVAPLAETLLVGEGIETCLGAIQATGLPAWAALSTSGMIALRLPPEVTNITVCADHDASGAGERAARTAAQRWLAEGRQVEIYISPHVREDAADLVLAAATEARHAA